MHVSVSYVCSASRVERVFSGVFDPHKYTNADMCRIHAITYECLMEDEESQVRGFVHFADGAGVSFPHLTLFTPKEAVRIVKNGEVRCSHAYSFLLISKCCNGYE